MAPSEPTKGISEDVQATNRAFTRGLAAHFAANPGKTFGVAEADGILVVVALAASRRGAALRAFAQDDWLAWIDSPDGVEAARIHEGKDKPT